MIEQIKQEMLSQDKRCTAYPIFIVVEDKKIYGVDIDFSEGRERKDTDMIDFESHCCEACRQEYYENGSLPEECDESECNDSFIEYKIEKDVPNLYAGFFFTAKACKDHIENNRHHYNSTVHSYGISATHNIELREVMELLIGEENINLLK